MIVILQNSGSRLIPRCLSLFPAAAARPQRKRIIIITIIVIVIIAIAGVISPTDNFNFCNHIHFILMEFQLQICSSSIVQSHVSHVRILLLQCQTQQRQFAECYHRSCWISKICQIRLHCYQFGIGMWVLSKILMLSYKFQMFSMAFGVGLCKLFIQQ